MVLTRTAEILEHSVRLIIFAGPATDRIFVLQIARFAVLTEPAADKIFWELHFVRLMVSARPSNHNFRTLDFQVCNLD